MNGDYLFFGKSVKVYENSKIIFPDNLFLDDYSTIGDFSFVLADKFIKIGKYSNIAPYVMITGGGEVYIEDFVEVSYGAKIISGTDDIFGQFLFTPSVPKEYRKISRQNVYIGKYSFIGANSIVYPGVTIGEGTIVNPGTIVRKSLKPWSIYDGAECKLLGKRKFKKEIIDKAEKLLLSNQKLEHK